MKQILVLACVGLVALAAMLTGRPAAAQSLVHQCASCHQVHGAAGFNRLLKESVVEVLCLTCHGPAGISTLKAAVHTNKRRSNYPAFSMSCRVCHDPHWNQAKNWLGTTNLKLVGSKQDTTRLARIRTPNSGIREVVFRSRGSGAGQPTLHSFADGDQDLNGYYDGICETCHTLARNHRNTASGDHTHNRGETCVRCHAHVNGFNR